MIEVLALAGAVTKIAGGISSAVQAGKDVNSLMPHFGKLAKLEADIAIAESGKHKGPLGRLASSEQEGFAIAQAKWRTRKLWKRFAAIVAYTGHRACGILWCASRPKQGSARKTHWKPKLLPETDCSGVFR